MNAFQDLSRRELGRFGVVQTGSNRNVVQHILESPLISSELRNIIISVICRSNLIEIRFIFYNMMYFKSIESKIPEIISIINTVLVPGLLITRVVNGTTTIYLSNILSAEHFTEEVLSKNLGSLLSAGKLQFERILMTLTRAKNEGIKIEEAVAKYFVDENYFRIYSEKKIQESIEREHKKIGSESNDESSDSEDDPYEEDSYDSDEELCEKTVKLDQDRVKALIKVPKISNKLDKDYFFNEATLEYHYNPANNLGNRLKNYKPVPSFEKSLLDYLKILYEEGYEFSALPVNFIMVEIHNSQIYDFSMAMHFYKRSSTPSSKEKIESYMTSRKEDLCKLIAESSSKDYILKYNMEETFSIDSFEFKDLDKIELGKGGFSTVYANKLHNREVAIKIPNKRKEDNTEAEERVFKEFHIIKSLSHRYIIKVLGVVRYQKMHCLVLEHVNSKSLVHSTTMLNRKEKLCILEKVAMGIGYVHSQNLCHYDIKPSNILLQGITPKIIDFGLAVVHKTPFPKSGFTTEYADPKQFSNADPGSPADIWAFGMTMYNFLTQRRPYYYIDQEEMKKDPRKFYQKIHEQQRRPQFTQQFSAKYRQEEEIMRSCWVSEFNKRIDAKNIISKLENLIKV